MPNESIYDFEAKDINGNIKKLSEFKGTALLVVNTASKCGFTPQFDGLEKLFKNYSNKGFQILGFPCNQFGSQEPGDENEIKNSVAEKVKELEKLLDEEKLKKEK